MQVADIAALGGLFLALVAAVWRMASKVDRLALVVEQVVTPRLDSHQKRLDTHSERIRDLATEQGRAQ